MSRSKKKTKIHGITTATSEKENKQDANRKFRRIVKQKLKSDPPCVGQRGWGSMAPCSND